MIATALSGFALIVNGAPCLAAMKWAHTYRFFPT